MGGGTQWFSSGKYSSSDGTLPAPTQPSALGSSTSGGEVVRGRAEHGGGWPHALSLQRRESRKTLAIDDPVVLTTAVH